MFKRIFVLLIAFAFICIMPLFASETTATDLRVFELSVKASPWTMQYIKYSDNYPSERTSAYGAGINTAFYYNPHPVFSLGSGVCYEYHYFKDFYSYSDFKIDLRGKFNLLRTKNNFFILSFYAGGGASLVLREDRDVGFYPLVIAGLDTSFKFNDSCSFNLGCDCNFTFQKGSFVIHVTPLIGLTYHFGKGASK